MRFRKLFAAISLISPVVSTVAIASCNNNKGITPVFVFNAEQVEVSYTAISLNNDFTFTAKPKDGYKITSVSVQIGEKEVTPTQLSSNTWKVNGSDVTNSSIEITIISTAIEETAAQYIYDRSFSLQCSNASHPEYGSLLGTFWILSDATKTTYTDFEYYIATNWHVKYGAETSFPSATIKYEYGDATSSQVVVSNYTTFSSFTWEAENNFCFETGDKTKAIDFYVARVKFGNNMPTQIKSKLNKLNLMQKNKGYINKFGEKASSSTKYTDKTLHIGGYPLKGSNIEWRYEEISPNKTSYYEKNHIFSGGVPGHEIDDDGLIVDISPQYGYTQADIPAELDAYGRLVPLDEYWGLSGGASGSMVVADIDGEWNVVGIYWGGLGATVGSNPTYYFLPMISLFRSSDKDFTTKYC